MRMFYTNKQMYNQMMELVEYKIRMHKEVGILVRGVLMSLDRKDFDLETFIAKYINHSNNITHDKQSYKIEEMENMISECEKDSEGIA